MTTTITEPTSRSAALVGGVGYLLLFVLALFANFFVLSGLVDDTSAAVTAANIAESQTLFRTGLLSFLAIFILDVVIAWALYVVFRPVSRQYSLLSAWFRLVYTVLLGVAVIFLFGDVPAYRAMSIGVQPGNDVAQLELALVELGYGQDGLVLVDGVFDDATEAAVIAWQADAGAQVDGVVELGEVVFLPESIRVASVLKSAGDPARDGEVVLVTSSDETFVTVRLSAEDQDLVAVGDSVAVELPDGTDVSATVTEIGSVAQTGPDGVSYFEMTVSLDDASAAVGLDEAPVDVDVVSDAASQVLAVPVTALVALSEGGYAVEVQGADGTTRLIAVETGLFADGTVEVTGSELEAGMLVIVP